MLLKDWGLQNQKLVVDLAGIPMTLREYGGGWGQASVSIAYYQGDLHTDSLPFPIKGYSSPFFFPD